MTPIERYLRDLRLRILWLPANVRRSILDEVRSHLTESARRWGGGVMGMERAIFEFGDVAEVARSYREVYEYGLSFKVVSCLLSLFLGLLSLPFRELAGSVVLLIAILYLVYIGLLAGKRVGVICGISADAGRAGLFLYYAIAYSDFAIYTSAELVLFVISLIILPFIGYLAGKAKERRFRPLF